MGLLTYGEWDAEPTNSLAGMEAHMTCLIARLASSLLLAGALLTGGASPTPVSAQSCDPAYVNVCVPPVSQMADVTCDYFIAQGISEIVLAEPSYDPRGFDSDYDAIGFARARVSVFQNQGGSGRRPAPPGQSLNRRGPAQSALRRRLDTLRCSRTARLCRFRRPASLWLQQRRARIQ